MKQDLCYQVGHRAGAACMVVTKYDNGFTHLDILDLLGNQTMIGESVETHKIALKKLDHIEKKLYDRYRSDIRHLNADGESVFTPSTNRIRALSNYMRRLARISTLLWIYRAKLGSLI